MSTQKGSGSAGGVFEKLVSGEVRRQSDRAKQREPAQELEVFGNLQGMTAWSVFEPPEMFILHQAEATTAEVMPGEPGKLFMAEGLAESDQETDREGKKTGGNKAVTTGDKTAVHSETANKTETKTPKTELETANKAIEASPLTEPLPEPEAKEKADAVFAKMPDYSTSPERELKPDEEPLSVSLADFAKQSAVNVKLPVKVGENFDVREPDFAEKLSEKIICKTDGGAKQFEIELAPKELGKVRINVVFENGKAVISLFCESARTQQVLSSHAESIRVIVEQSSKHEAVININRQNEEQGRRENDDGKNHDGGQSQKQNRRPKREEMTFFIDQLKMDMLIEAV